MTPATPKPLNRSSPNITYVITSWISTIMQNFIQIDFARQIVYSAIFSFLWGVLQIIYSQDAVDARTDFDAKYVKRRGSAQGCAF